MQCEMMGCKQEVFNSLSIGPGTYIPLCKIHYDSVKVNLGEVNDEQSGMDNQRPDEGDSSGMGKLD